jgi:hypothetical protein
MCLLPPAIQMRRQGEPNMDLLKTIAGSVSWGENFERIVNAIRGIATAHIIAL